MGTYIHEWNAFNRRMLLHFNSRQDALEMGLAGGWIRALHTAQPRVNGERDEGDGDKGEIQGDTDINGSDKNLLRGGKGGISVYLRGVEEDFKMRKHWEMACEMHREAILDLGRLWKWIQNGGKVV